MKGNNVELAEGEPLGLVQDLEADGTRVLHLALTGVA